MILPPWTRRRREPASRTALRARLGSRHGLLRGVDDLAIEHSDLADVLHRDGRERRAELGELGCAFFPVHRSEPDLDQTMALERAIDLFQHRIGQSLRPDDHDRVQGVGARPEGAALGRR